MSSTREFWTVSNSWTDEFNELIVTDPGGGVAIGEIRQVDGMYTIYLYPYGEFGGVEIYDIDSHESFDDAYTSAIAILDDFFTGE